MFVSDLNLFTPSNMKVRVTDMNGVDKIFDFTPNLTVDQVKFEVVRQFYVPNESLKNSLYHKIVLVRTGHLLVEQHSLCHNGVLDNDELLLLRRRLPNIHVGTTDKTKEEERKGPTSDQINKATASLERTGKLEEVEELPNPLDFQSELRRILIALIEASQRIICLTEDAPKIYKQAKEIINGPSVPARFDEKALKQLMEMGFAESKARSALTINGMSLESSMEWLFQHESDPDTEENGLSDEASGGPAEEGAEAACASTEPTSHVHHMLESFKALRKKEFQPNRRALHNLMEMGFEEVECIAALRMSRNDQQAACDWLLGDRHTRLEDLDDGLDPNGPVFQAIMSNPTVQLGLNNPRCLLAFLQMLDNPTAASQWLNDPDTGPILVQISRIYHAEKNSSKTVTAANS